MKKVLLYVFLAGAIFNCEFPLEKKNFVEVSPTPTTDVKINLLNLPDTVTVINDLTISYELDVKNAPAGGIYASIGNEVGYVGQAFEGSFVIPHINDQIIGKGYLPFEFFVIATTGTGSLADNSYRETKIFSVKKTLYFDYSPVVPITINEIAFKDGSLNISWNKYPYPNLTTLILRRTVNGGLAPDLYVSPTATNYIDSDFIGYSVSYQLVTTNNLGSSAIGPMANYMSAYTPQILGFKDSGNDVQVTWNKVPYSGSTGYKILDFDGNVLFSTSNLLDTTASITVPFGLQKELMLVVSSKSYFLESGKKSVWLGKKIPKFSSVIYDKAHDQFFYLDPPYLMKDKSGTRDSTTFDFDLGSTPSLAADGNTIYLTKGNNIIYEIATNDLSLVNTYTLSDYFSSFVSSGSQFIVQSGYNVEVIDKTTLAVVQVYPGQYGNLSNTNDTHYILSEDGINVYLHSLDQNGLIVESKHVPGWIGFFDSNNQNLYVLTFDAQAATSVRQSLTFPGFNYSPDLDRNFTFFHLDPNYVDKAMRIGISSNSTSGSIIDLETLQEISGVSLADYPTILRGGVLFRLNSGVAFALKVK